MQNYEFENRFSLYPYEWHKPIFGRTLHHFLPEITIKSEFRHYASFGIAPGRGGFAVSIGNWKFKREGFTVNKDSQ